MSGDKTKIANDELTPQGCVVAAQTNQPVDCRCDAGRVIADRQRHRIRWHRLTVQSQPIFANHRAAQPWIVECDRPWQTVEAERNPQQAQPLT
jgi:hypothetical protein